VLIRPSIKPPTPQPPCLDFKTEHKIKNFIDPSQIRFKPDPPWMNRNEGEIQFTEKMYTDVS